MYIIKTNYSIQIIGFHSQHFGNLTVLIKKLLNLTICATFCDLLHQNQLIQTENKANLTDLMEKEHQCLESGRQRASYGIINREW